MKQPEIMKHAADIFEFLESKNMSFDDMYAIISKVLATLMAQKMIDEIGTESFGNFTPPKVN